jgi:hypothetical protein
MIAMFLRSSVVIAAVIDPPAIVVAVVVTPIVIPVAPVIVPVPVIPIAVTVIPVVSVEVPAIVLVHDHGPESVVVRPIVVAVALGVVVHPHLAVPSTIVIPATSTVLTHHDYFAIRRARTIGWVTIWLTQDHPTRHRPARDRDIGGDILCLGACGKGESSQGEKGRPVREHLKRLALMDGGTEGQPHAIGETLVAPIVAAQRRNRDCPREETEDRGIVHRVSRLPPEI